MTRFVAKVNSFNRIVADKLHRVTLTLHDAIRPTDSFVFASGSLCESRGDEI